MATFRITFKEDSDVTTDTAETSVREFVSKQTKLESPKLRSHDTRPIEVDLEVIDATDADENSALNLLRDNFWQATANIDNVVRRDQNTL